MSPTPGRFTYRSDPVRIVFGAGAIAELPAEASLHNMSRLMVLCSKSRADFARRVTASIADRCVTFCDASEPNMPREVFERIVDDIKRQKLDGFVVIGGGSPIGLAKAAAATTKIPYIAVVTTYSGSEMAARWRIGIADDRISGDGPAALPATAIYDPELTLDLPARFSAASGMNAMAHAVESLYGIDTNPIDAQAMAEEAISKAPFEPARAWCKIRAISMPAAMCSTAPGSRQISAPRSGSSTPSRNGCGNGSISTMLTLMPSRRPTPSVSTAPRHPRPWRASSALRSARAKRRAAFTIFNVRLGLPTGFKGLGCARKNIGKAVDIVAGRQNLASSSSRFRKPTSPKSFARAFFGEPPRFPGMGRTKRNPSGNREVG